MFSYDIDISVYLSVFPFHVKNYLHTMIICLYLKPFEILKQ